MEIRKIQKTDNKHIAEVIRTVLIDLNVPKVGTAFADLQLDAMFETYNLPKFEYYVIEHNNKVVGGAGIAPLENGDLMICELQKMYFLPEARGLGMGSKMISLCLQRAKEMGYKKCYLETMPNMENAQKMYLKFGFEYIPAPMGNTGHTNCPIWMLKDL